MAAFIFKLGSLDLSSYARMNPDDHLDPYSAHFVEPSFAETPFSDGQVLISTTVQNREQQWPLYLVDATRGKDQVHALIQQIGNAAAQRPLVLEWRDSGASASTFFDVAFVRFEPNFNYRQGVHGYAAGILHVWTTGYGHTGTTRVTATAAGTGIFLSVPIPSVAGDTPALIDTTIVSGAVLPSLGRIVAVAPIQNPSYTPRIPAASLTDAQTNATLVGASGADGSQYLALPISPTGGASGIACKVPLPNPTIAGGDNRILAVVKAGIDAGVGITALDPYGNTLGPTAIASFSQGFGLVDLGVCRLPTVGYPTQPKISIQAGGVWASGAAGPAILASPAGLALNEILCLPDKNLTLLYERGAVGAASILSKDGFPNGALPLGVQNDSVGNPWGPAYNNANAIGGPATGHNLLEAPLFVAPGFGQTGTLTIMDGDNLPALQSDSMVISAKAYFASPGLGFEEVRLLKDRQASQFLAARFAASKFLALAAATGDGGPSRLLASVQIATISAAQKYRLALQCQGPGAFVTLSRDDGGPVFAPGSMAQASIGVASDAGVAGAGAPGLAMSIPSGFITYPRLYSWEVDTVPFASVPGLLAFDSYRLDGVNTDAYRTSSAGVFAGAKLTSVQRGAFPKMAPSTVSVAVVCAPVDQGAANDLITAAVSIRERYTYSR